MPFRVKSGGGDANFYPKEDCNLEDVTSVESDDMRVIPADGTDYYPYIYLASKPYPAQAGDEFEPCGKRFNGQTQEHSVGVFLNLINLATGESAVGYPQQISQTTCSIVSGGYMRVKNWNVSANASQVSVTIQRYNPTYTKPLEYTFCSASVTPFGALDAYSSKPYVVTKSKANFPKPQE